MKINRILSIAAIAALTIGLAACSGKATSETTEENASENLENVPNDLNVDVAADVTEAQEELTGEPADAVDQASETVVDKVTDAASKVADAAAKVSDKAAEAAGKVEAAKEVVTAVVNHNKFTAETIRPDSKVGRVTVIDFNATWCVPCKALTPVFKGAEKTFGKQIDFLEVDIDKYKATADAFKVTAVPTVVIMRPDGKVSTYVGTGDLLPADKFTKLLQDALK